MENMGNWFGIVDILIICLLLGVIIVCAILIVLGVLRWLASSGNPDKRRTRLNFAGWISFAVLATMILYSQRKDITAFLGNTNSNQTLTTVIINGSKMAFKFLLLGTVFAIVAIITLVLILLVSKGVCAAFSEENTSVKDWAKNLKEVGKQFGNIIKTPIFTFFVTCGILLVFIVLPFLLGNSEDTASLAETWGDVVHKIASSINKNDTTTIAEDTIWYILLYIIILGVGFSVARILYAIVKDNLKQKHSVNLIDEYSSSMGIMGVGVSILLVLYYDGINQDKPLDVVLAFLKYFLIVAVALTLAIVILEIIRLVMDMRETLIRREARYLFVALVGQASLLILVLLDSIFSALNSAVGQGRADVDISHIQNKLIQRITNTMEREIDRRTENRDATFAIFRASVTKK